jgi:hypothetical protein
VFLGVSHYSQIESIPVAGQVLGPAFPGVLRLHCAAVLLARADWRRIHDADRRFAHDDLSLPRHREAGLALHEAEQGVPGRVRDGGSRCRRCSRRSGRCRHCSKAIIAMVGNLLLAPVAVVIIFYFINQRRMGEFKAGVGRNLVLLTTLVFALSLAITGVVRFLR